MAQGFRAMARREEGEYSTYSTDEQRRQRVKDQARWEQNGAVEALGCGAENVMSDGASVGDVHFEPYLPDSAVVAFHDYADYFPSVRSFVDELLVTGRYQKVNRADSRMVLRKLAVRAAEEN
jgi:hypothetical protein